MLTHVKKLINAENFDPRKNIFDLRNPRKKYVDPRNPRRPRKNLTQATHGPTDPRNPHTHVTHVVADSVTFMIDFTMFPYTENTI